MKNLTNHSLQASQMQYNVIIHYFDRGVAIVKNKLKNILIAVAAIVMLAAIPIVIFDLQFLDSEDQGNAALYHQQYLSGKSEQIMNQMKADEQEAKLKQEYGLTWMQHIHDK